MKNLWPTNFEPNTLRAPKAILEEQAGFLGTITGGIVTAVVSSVSSLEAMSHSLQDDFVFRLDLIAPFLDNFKFTVLRLSHDIALYPVKVSIDESIGKELGLKKDVFSHDFTAANPNEVEAFLEQVFQSERLKAVVGSIISLSK